jgi:hypothetical protein
MNALRSLALLILAITAFHTAGLRAGVEEQSASAASALRSGHPLEALETYRTILTSPRFATEGSPELWYDRGLAEEKTGDAAAASLSFRRALLLDPGSVATRHQLSLVLATLGLPGAPGGWKERLSLIIHPERLVLAGALTGWAGVLMLTFLLIRGPRRKGWIALSLLLLICGHGASVLGTFADPRRVAADEAVVTAKTAPVLRATPADNGTAGAALPPGSVVSVLSRNGSWWYVSGGPGLDGWIHSESITPLLPASSSR